MPQRASLLAALSAGAAAAAAAAPSAADLRRATQRVPRAALRGGDFAGTSDVLNNVLKGYGVPLADCDDVAKPALDALLATLLAAASPELDAVYAAGGDARGLRKSGVAGYEREWGAGGDAALAAAAHSAKCHHAVMLWVHHVPAAARGALRGAGAALPLLPRRRHFADAAPGDHPARDAYVRATACAFCHGQPQPFQPTNGSDPGAPAWPPAMLPEWPTQFSSTWFGWVSDVPGINLTGRFSYDYVKNRLREDSAGGGFSQSMYWFGSPRPDGEADLPAGVQEGGQYRVMTFGGNTSCSFHVSPGMSVTRPDGFANGGRIAPERLTYLGRRLLPEAGRWADGWQFNDDPCGNFSVWGDIDTHAPLKSGGPTGCGTGASESYWTQHVYGPPAASVFADFDFTTCAEGDAAARRRWF